MRWRSTVHFLRGKSENLGNLEIYIYRVSFCLLDLLQAVHGIALLLLSSVKKNHRQVLTCLKNPIKLNHIMFQYDLSVMTSLRSILSLKSVLSCRLISRLSSLGLNAI